MHTHTHTNFILILDLMRDKWQLKMNIFDNLYQFGFHNEFIKILWVKRVN